MHQLYSNQTHKSVCYQCSTSKQDNESTLQMFHACQESLEVHIHLQRTGMISCDKRLRVLAIMATGKAIDILSNLRMRFCHAVSTCNILLITMESTVMQIQKRQRKTNIWLNRLSQSLDYPSWIQTGQRLCWRFKYKKLNL